MFRSFIPPFIRYIWPYIEHHKWRLGISAAALITTSFMILSIGHGLKSLIDNNTDKFEKAYLVREVCTMLLASSFLAASSFVRIANTNYLGEVITAELRVKLFSHLLSLDQDFFEERRVGSLLSHLYGNTAKIQAAVSTSVAVAFRSILQASGSVFMMAKNNFRLALFIFCMVSIILSFITYLGKKIRLYASQEQNHLAQIESLSEETLNAITTVQATRSSFYFQSKYRSFLESYCKSAKSKVIIRSLLVSSVVGLSFSSISIILWIGGRNVLDGSTSLGELSTFIFYAVVAAGSLNNLGDVFGEINSASLALEQITSILSLTSKMRDLEKNVQVQVKKEITHDIHFEKVTFYYPTRPARPVLKNLSFSVRNGEKVVIVGPSGSGKSTIFKLMLRFYDIKSGSIFLSKINLREISLDTLRSFYAFVPQSPVIFNMSVRENLTLGQNLTDNSLQKTCELVSLWTFIQTLPSGLSTMLGEKGALLSGGQRQRIALARALLLEAPILLLDEATSALDMEGERDVHKSLEKFIQGRTTLIITHRPTTVYKMDRVILIDNEPSLSH